MNRRHKFTSETIVVTTSVRMVWLKMFWAQIRNRTRHRIFTFIRLLFGNI